MANPDQNKRGCNHEKTYHVWTDHPKYGDKVPYVVSQFVEVACDYSCGGRQK